MRIFWCSSSTQFEEEFLKNKESLKMFALSSVRCLF